MSALQKSLNQSEVWSGRISARFGGLSLGLGLLVDQAGEVGAHVDEFVQDPVIVRSVFRRLVGGFSGTPDGAS
jgi:hypothetical protein